MSKKYRLRIYKSLTRDNFENGCSIDPKDGQDFGCIYSEDATKLKHLIDTANSFAPLEYAEEIDGYLSMNRQENENGETPTASEWERFKSGEIDLYLADYSFFLSEVIETELNAATLLDRPKTATEMLFGKGK